MNLLLSTFVCFCLCTGTMFGQVETVYKKLKTEKCYSVKLGSYTHSGTHVYTVNRDTVDKKTYNKFASTWDNLENCCPCILQSYDANDVLLNETVSCADCGVGWFKEYYPSGALKLRGSYKENPTEDWKDIWARGFCNIPNGEWIFYDENGTKRYSEIWDNGMFIKQSPKQDSLEIWKINLVLNGTDATQLTLESDELKELEIVPYFKNNKTTNDFEIELSIWSEEMDFNLPPFSMESFKEFDLDRFLVENGFTKQDTFDFGLTVIHNEINYGYFSLSIATNLPDSPMEPDGKQKEAFIDLKEISDENSDIYLVSSLDSTKKIRVKQNGTMELHYEFDFADSLIESKSSYLQGKIERVSDTTLSFQTWSENTYLTYYSGIETDSYTQYTSDYTKEIRINQIEYLQYNSPVRESFHGIGNLTASLGTIAAVLVAPLVSINFKNGDFNKNRYYTVAGCGLIGLAVSIPIIALTKPKEYRLLEKDADPERGYWYLESTIQK